MYIKCCDMMFEICYFMRQQLESAKCVCYDPTPTKTHPYRHLSVNFTLLLMQQIKLKISNSDCLLAMSFQFHTSGGFISTVPAGSCSVILQSSGFVVELLPSKHSKSKSPRTYTILLVSGQMQSTAF